MAEALYRTYRPQTFADVVNQQHVRITLQHALEQDRVAHAYLFAGPRGVGKTTLARILARAVNCTQRKKDGEPCNTCASCQALLGNKSLDVVEIDAASQTGVDNVRENIIQSARAIPAMAAMKVFIIDEVHMLSTSAFNALLKLLEEPPAHAMFILATTEAHRIPETIISRTQRFDFKKIGLADITSRLQYLAQQEKRQLDHTVAERIARRAGGSIRDAESMLGQLFSFEERHITDDIADLVLPRSDDALVMELVTALVRRQTLAAVNTFHRYCDDGGDIDQLVTQVITLGRALVLAAVDQSLLDEAAPFIDRREAPTFITLAQATTLEHLTAIIEEFMNAARLLNRAQLTELHVELAIIKVTHMAGTDAGPTTPVSSRAV
ncbi:MAG: DNA polymerase III subunit gamma/tau, partial [Candidatus Kerfeldbacteria bacterium]|nr:DNA polymerase III subunit gamma/tau [Candidatus Kerfeldbacteria bacterium]